MRPVTTRRGRPTAAHRLWCALGAGALGAAMLQGVAGTAGAAPPQACADRSNNQYSKLLACVTLAGVERHLDAFQRIADESTDPVYPDSRAAGTEGYDASVDYVAGLLEDAGYAVTLDPVDVTFNFPAVLRQLTPTQATYPSGAYTGSDNGTVQGPVRAVDTAGASSGCTADDFAGTDWSGTSDIALIKRGTCGFRVKAYNAEVAGAEAVVIYNDGADPTREGLIVGTLVPADPAVPASWQASIPVVGASKANGDALQAPGSTALVQVRPSETRQDVNVIAERTGTVDPDNVVMAGAHLDSVPAGPGINDNGSGSAALLETALMMAHVDAPNTTRFAWWAAEEQGLVGSNSYVAKLSQAERDRIALYMNYDMVGSPNGIFMVYDADTSSFPAPAGVPIPEGSEAIEDLYEQYYTSVGQPYEDSQFSGRSDYQAFILAGIPSSGLFTGAEVVKTAEQAAIWGGTAGAQFDPCYHLACDTRANIDAEALAVNSDLIAYAMLTFAYSTESVNGVPGKRVPGKAAPLPAPAGPEGTFVPAGGGGLAPDHDHDHDHEGPEA